jgi:hypothetical protein
METAQTRTGNHDPVRRRLPLDLASIRGVLAQGVMNAVVVIIVHVVSDQPPQMLFVQRDDVVEDLAAATPTQRSATPFCHGACTLVRLGFRPVAFRNLITSASNFESRSRMT